MTKVAEVFRFELAYQFRRASTLGYFVMVVVMCMSFLHMMATGSSLDGTHYNSPFALTVLVTFGSMLALLVLAAYAGDAATRDVETRMHPLFYTSPIGKRAYLLGRFLGAFATSALLLLAFPLGAVLTTWMPWVDAGSVAPFHASSYLRPYLFFALPNAFVATALLFGAAVLARRAIASYAGAAFLFFSAIVSQKLLAPRLGWDVAKLLDPLGYTTVQAFWKSTNATQKNAFVLALDGTLLANRLLWLGVALTVLAAAYVRFRFAHEAVGGAAAPPSNGSANEGRAASRRVAVPAVRRAFDASTRARQLWRIAMHSFAELHTSRAWWIVPLLALLFVQAAPELALLEMGIPGPLTTARLLDFLTGDVSILLTLLIALSAGELVWRERDARMHAVSGVTPVPDWLSVTGKFLGIAMMLAATMIIVLVAGLTVQMLVGTDRYDLTLYARILFGLQLPEYLLTAALAMIVHVLVNQKYVANVLIVFAPFARDLLHGLGVENDLWLYGALPAWVHSDISGFGLSAEARLWFMLYFGGWALLFALATYLFWIRGEEYDLRQRMALARRRLTRPAAAIGATALAVIGGAGGFIVYNTRIANHHVTAAESEQQRAEFERRYGRYASLPQPAPVATTLHVDFHPRRRAATIRGSYRLENRTGAPVGAIHCAISSLPKRTAVSFDRAARATVTDDERGYRIYALERPLQPGESMRMHFQVDIRASILGSDMYGIPPVVQNGSMIMHRPGRGDHWVPLVGYQTSRELDHPVLRSKYGLRKRPPYPQLGDVAAGNEQRGHAKIELETIVGTDAGQIGVAPGAMRRTWTANGRRYVHYRTDAPISDAYTIAAANYAVHRAKWRDVDIEIFHHPSHSANLERMVHAVRASLAYNTEQFGPYPHRQVRLVEYPSPPHLLNMSAHSGFITYAEGFSFVRVADDPRKVDFPFAVVAHEMAHQWFGHQLTPAAVEGAPFLSESLAWYSGMLVVEQTFGRDHLKALLDMMRDQYMGPQQPRAFPLLRAVDSLDAYRTGPFAMYALREAAGVATVNGALRNLLVKFPPGRSPFPTSLDFYRELRAATPASMHALLKDLFEEITFWELSAKGIDVTAAGNGTYRVVLQVEARKLKGDGTDQERPVPMNDPVEILVYDADGKPLHRARHRIRSGLQAIEIVVSRPPAGATLDPDRELLDRNPDDDGVAVVR